MAREEKPIRNEHVVIDKNKDVSGRRSDRVMPGGDDARFIPEKPFHARVAGQLRFSTSQRVGPSRILIDHQDLEIDILLGQQTLNGVQQWTEPAKTGNDHRQARLGSKRFRFHDMNCIMLSKDPQ
jgi:hypothetical protein